MYSHINGKTSSMGCKITKGALCVTMFGARVNVCDFVQALRVFGYDFVYGHTFSVRVL